MAKRRARQLLSSNRQTIKISSSSCSDTCQLLYFAVFLATSSGCLECCLPLCSAARFLALDRAYSLSDKASRALRGRYRSPVASLPWVEFLPLLVPQSSLVQESNDFCDLDLAISLSQQLGSMTESTTRFSGVFLRLLGATLSWIYVRL